MRMEHIMGRRQSPTFSPVTALATDALCNALYCLPHEEVHALDNFNFAWMLPVRGQSLLLAVETIRYSISTAQNDEERLKCVATLHAWLIPRGAYFPWFLYCRNGYLATMDSSSFAITLFGAMNSSGYTVIPGVVDAGDTLCVAGLVVLREPPFIALMCVCIWRELPFVAIHATGMTVHEAVKWPMLASLLGDLETCLLGVFNDLTEALDAAYSDVRQRNSSAAVLYENARSEQTGLRTTARYRDFYTSRKLKCCVW
ncbi:hypothetical protein HPB50_016323 [Hyalomma asiaticum]|uniref:Uncharacterized protein n=1 Tax=Hyalomma asiaticum TaxID=266040 RepID=A0ACB7RPE7_HYAAI|nr:hypothetical protein HPB50_016323 [Hyalomma asiaticum]